MARPKKVDTDTASIVDEKNSTVETTETPAVDEIQNEPEKEQKDKPAVDKKPKKFGDNEKVIIKCAAYAGKSIILPTRIVDLDENGKCEVTGIEANRLLTIPGYELAK